MQETQEPQDQYLGREEALGEEALGEETATLSSIVILPGKSHEHRSLVDYSHRGTKSQT